ncbi:hypothetical protein GCM10011393_16150 [Sphingopyxis bauzanensis]|nr:hypothetical protein GCM10011393_16150 [Sphingopyxis bauzanensis]
MPKMASSIDRLKPSDEAASSVGPSHPTINTSVAPISDIVRFVRISGQASASVARNSARYPCGFSEVKGMASCNIAGPDRRGGAAVQSRAVIGEILEDGGGKKATAAGVIILPVAKR